MKHPIGHQRQTPNKQQWEQKEKLPLNRKSLSRAGSCRGTLLKKTFRWPAKCLPVALNSPVDSSLFTFMDCRGSGHYCSAFDLSHCSWVAVAMSEQSFCLGSAKQGWAQLWLWARVEPGPEPEPEPEPGPEPELSLAWMSNQRTNRGSEVFTWKSPSHKWSFSWSLWSEEPTT